MPNPRALATALRQELVIEKEGRYVAPNAELLAIVKQEVLAGFPLEAVLEDGDLLLEDLERIATRFRRSFFQHIVNPNLQTGMKGQALADVAAKVAVLRPLAVRLVSILLARAIERGGGPVTGETPRKPKARSRIERAPARTRRKGKRG